jgi:hypothetical protein
MESKIWDKITGSFELDLPSDLATLEQSIEFIVPRVQSWSEDLWEEKFYTNKRWKEIRDADTYHEVVLHMFMQGGEYLVVIDGDITKGAWHYMKETNTFIVDYGGKSSLFDLVFLNGDFFILRKHGDQARKGKQKYYVYGNEKSTGKLDWRNAMEKLYNLYRENSKFSMWLFAIIAFIIFVLFYSINY